MAQSSYNLEVALGRGSSTMKFTRDMRESITKLNETCEALSALNEQHHGRLTAIASGTWAQVKKVARIIELVEDVNSALETVATGSKQQAQQFNQVSVLMNEITVATDEVADDAQSLTAAAGQTLNATNEGSQAVQNTVKGMKAIAERVVDLEKRLQRLADHSTRIDQIIKVITDIAKRTNLLALNAAIEAARAGEHGRGFAVVAEEVRGLAERSSKAGEEISSLILSIQEETSLAVTAMEASIKEVSSGTQIAENAGVALEEIRQTTASNHQQIQRISTNAKDNATRIAQVVSGIDGTAEITQRNAATAAEMAEADWFSRAIRDFRELATDTAGNADDLLADTRATLTELQQSFNDHISSMLKRLDEVELEQQEPSK